jgi:mannose-6-phosphate isomerase-like protein (cupin superfamily)
MIYKHIDEVPAFVAGDATHIREVLHPKNDGNDLLYSLAHATLEPGAASLPHTIKERSEAYIITEGHGTAYVGGKAMVLSPGVVVLIPAGVEQFVRNEGSGPLRFWCIVSPPWQADQEEIRAE